MREWERGGGREEEGERVLLRRLTARRRIEVTTVSQPGTKARPAAGTGSGVIARSVGCDEVDGNRKG